MAKLTNILKEVNLMGTSTQELLDKVLQFEDKTLIFFDTETMGLNPNKSYSQLLQLGIIVLDGNSMTEVESHNIKIRFNDNIDSLFKSDSPERKEWDKKSAEKSYKSPTQILSMTHYFENKDARVMSEAEALDLFKGIVGGKYPSPILLAHNASFDMNFINTRASINKIKIDRVPVIDTLKISQLYFIPILQGIKSKLATELKFTKVMKVADIKPKDPNAPKSHRPSSTEFERGKDPETGEETLTIRTGQPSSSLGKLAVALFHKVENWHSALADTKTMIDVFKKIIEYLTLHKDLDIRKNKETAFRVIKRREAKLAEELELMRHSDGLVIKSDKPNKAEASRETFKNKSKLKDAGFKWDASIGLWKAKASELEHAQKILNKINKIEKFVEKVEDLQEFVYGVGGDLTKKDELGLKIEGFIAELSSAVDDVAASKVIQDYLTFNSKFTSYSLYNTILIYLQNKNATQVAGFRAWETKFGRRVKKGAKGISILAPIISNNSDKDSKVNDAGLDDAVKSKRIHGFKAINVFDIADTEAIEGGSAITPTQPKWHADDEPSEVADKISEYVLKVSENLGVSISNDPSKEGEQGFSRGDHINISSGVAGANKAGTLLHELAHSLLHFKSSIFHIDDEKSDKQTKELQAEAVSFVVLRHYDIPAEHQSTYLALFKVNSEAVKGNLDVIKKASNFIIKEIDKVATAEESSEVEVSEN